jgi:hypothetical protein
MPSVAHTMQMTLSLDLALPERFGTLREYVAHRVTVQAKPAKTIAAEMDIAPSTLSRKLNPAEGDTQRFNLDDLEHYLECTGDVHAVVDYLLSKYAKQADEDRRVRAQARLLDALEQFPDLLAAAGITTLSKARPHAKR